MKIVILAIIGAFIVLSIVAYAEKSAKKYEEWKEGKWVEITYMVIVTVVTLGLGAITKAFKETIPSKYIPLQNIIIGILAGVICYFAGVETNLLQAFILCITASAGAGGLYDLTKTGKEEKLWI